MRVSAACFLRRIANKGPGPKRGVGGEPAVVSLAAAAKKKKTDDAEAKAGAATCRTDIQENQLVLPACLAFTKQ